MISAGTASAVPERMGYDKDQATVAQIASYIGFDKFCRQYGIDFGGVANQLHDYLSRRSFWVNSTGARRDNLDKLYRVSESLGTQGYVYVPAFDNFTNQAKPGYTQKDICADAYDAAVKIFNLMN